MRAVALVGWLGIVGALLVWQGIGLVREPEWPTLSDFTYCDQLADEKLVRRYATERDRKKEGVASSRSSTRSSSDRPQYTC